MNLTTDNSIAEIVNAIADIPYPSHPTKPSVLALGKSPTPDDFRNHATLLEKYESDLAEYNAKRGEYYAEKNKLESVFVEKLFSESSLTRPVFDAVYAKAYADGHSGGYFEVAGTFEELEAFALRIIELNAK